MTGGGKSILIDARVNAWPGGHGLARSVLKLTEHMGPDAGGLPVRVLVNRSGPQLFPLDDVSERAELIDTDISPAATRSHELGQLIRDLGAAVFYAPYALFAPAVCACPMVVTLYDCLFVNSRIKNPGGWYRRFLIKAMTTSTLRRAAAVTAPTKAILGDIRRQYPTAPKPTLIPNGVEVSQFAGADDQTVAAIRERYDLPERFVLTVGNRRPHKNQGILIRALALMPPQVSLVIVGYPEPKFRDQLPQLVSDLGLESRVNFVPELPDEDLPAMYRAASVFAFPSVLEGYGLPVLEAMSAGVPVVASDIPPLEEVCRSAAILVPPLDATAWAKALMHVMEDPATAPGMVAAGIAVATEASWDRGGRALRELLLSVTESS